MKLQERIKLIESYLALNYINDERPSKVTASSLCKLSNELPTIQPCANLDSDALMVESSLMTKGIRELIERREESFSEMLLRLIDSSECSDVEIYKRANVDRKLFSKIRSDREYKPSKQTAISLAFGLRLGLDESLDLISRAGYTLSKSSKFDLIIRYFLQEGIYDIDEVNQALYAFDQSLLCV